MEMEKKMFGKQMVAHFQHRDTERTWLKQTLLGSSLSTTLILNYSYL